MKLEIFLFQGQGKGGKHLPYQGGQLHRFLFRYPFHLSPGQLQQAAYQSGHAVALREYHVQVLIPLRRGDVLPQGLGVGTEDSQGGFQLVGRRPGKVPFPLDSPALAVVGKESHGNGGQQSKQGGGFQLLNNSMRGNIGEAIAEQDAVGQRITGGVGADGGGGEVVWQSIDPSKEKIHLFL